MRDKTENEVGIKSRKVTKNRKEDNGVLRVTTKD